MPPGPDHAPLSSAEADLLERWISEGAPYDKHWAYQAPDRPEAPGVDAPLAPPEWVRGDIDRWILDGLADSGLEPAPRADAAGQLKRIKGQ